jgi:hypothetical protein
LRTGNGWIEKLGLGRADGLVLGDGVLLLGLGLGDGVLLLGLGLGALGLADGFVT